MWSVVSSAWKGVSVPVCTLSTWFSTQFVMNDPCNVCLLAGVLSVALSTCHVDDKFWNLQWPHGYICYWHDYGECTTVVAGVDSCGAKTCIPDSKSPAANRDPEHHIGHHTVMHCIMRAYVSGRL